jgi:hypothetical protein
MALRFFLSLFPMAVYAVIKAEDRQWKWINVGIIVGAMALAFVGILDLVAVSEHPDQYAILPYQGSLFAGSIAAIGTIAWNYWRNGGIRKGRKPKSESDRTVV